MTTMDAGVYRFEWYAFAPTCASSRGGGAGQLPVRDVCGPPCRRRTHLPALDVLHDLLFADERSLLPPVDVAVVLGEHGRDEVDARPRPLALQLTVVVGEWGRRTSQLDSDGWEHNVRSDTHRFSRLPWPTRQKPKAQMAVTAPKMRAPPGPLVGRLRLYLMAGKPPCGGRSLRVCVCGQRQRARSGGEEGEVTVDGVAAAGERDG